MNILTKLFAKRGNVSFKNSEELRALNHYIDYFSCLPKHFIEINTGDNAKIRVYHSKNEYFANDGISPNKIIDSGLIHGSFCWFCFI